MRVVRCLDAAYDLSRYAEAFTYGNYLLGILLGQIYLETVAAVEDLVHFLPVGAALLLDCAEQRRNGEQVVLDDVDVLHKVQNLGLGAA